MGPHLSRPTTTLPRDMLELYTDRDLKGTVKMIGPVTSQSQLHYHSVDPLPDQITSMRWNLPEGVLVIFYDNFDGTGRQLVIWNKGEFESVSPFTMNDKISSYSWYRIGESSSR